jgi:hypothetical protein
MIETKCPVKSVKTDERVVSSIPLVVLKPAS